MSTAGRRGDGVQLKRREKRNGPAQGPLLLVNTKLAFAKAADTSR